MDYDLLMYHRELVLLLSGAGYRYCQKSVVMDTRVGSTAVEVAILTFPPCLKKSSGRILKAKYCLQAKHGPLRIRNL